MPFAYYRAGCHCAACSSGRWPSKPRRDDRCDAYTGWGTDPYGQPLLKRCKNLAVVTNLTSETMHIPAYMCDEHRKQGVRNPKVKGDD